MSVVDQCKLFVRRRVNDGEISSGTPDIRMNGVMLTCVMVDNDHLKSFVGKLDAFALDLKYQTTVNIDSSRGEVTLWIDTKSPIGEKGASSTAKSSDQLSTAGGFVLRIAVLLACGVAVFVIHNSQIFI